MEQIIDYISLGILCILVALWLYHRICYENSGYTSFDVYLEFNSRIKYIILIIDYMMWILIVSLLLLAMYILFMKL